MKPRITVVTLGVRDLVRSLRFYRDGLGLATEGVVGAEFEGGAVAFFPLAHGQLLALFPLDQLAKDGNVGLSDDGAPRSSLGHNVSSKHEVDDVMEQARAAGATIGEACPVGSPGDVVDAITPVAQPGRIGPRGLAEARPAARARRRSTASCSSAGRRWRSPSTW